MREKMVSAWLPARSGSQSRQALPAPLTDEEIDAEIRVFEVQCLFSEMRTFGLEPPIGLKCVAALFVAGRADVQQMQEYLDSHLSDSVSFMEARDA